MLTLVFMLVLDLSEQQRERLNTYFANGGIELPKYTVDLPRGGVPRGIRGCFPDLCRTQPCLGGALFSGASHEEQGQR